LGETISGSSASITNEEGDHCHLDGVEYPYVFTTVEKLMEDFVAEVERRT